MRYQLPGRVALLLLTASLCLAQAQLQPPGGPDTGPGCSQHVLITPDAIQWKPFFLGGELGVISGNPDKSGEFIVRARMPDGNKILPHWHPTDENITVLKGTMLLGMGEKFDPALAKPLTEGSFAHLPAGMRHFAMSQGETIIQIEGMGPFAITFVNPSDDPRNQNKGH